jgi:hypothetical protein
MNERWAFVFFTAAATAKDHQEYIIRRRTGLGSVPKSFFNYCFYASSSSLFFFWDEKHRSPMCDDPKLRAELQEEEEEEEEEEEVLEGRTVGGGWID